VDDDGELLCQWDPVIPFAGARLVQRIEIELAGNSRFYWSDGLMSGRVSRGETWRFQSMEHELRVNVGGFPGYVERYRLVPSERRPRRSWIAGLADYIGTLVVRHGGVTPAFVENLQAQFADPSAAVDLVDARLGLMVGRFLSASGTAWQRERAACRDGVLESLFGRSALSFRR
jgi:urease accessory protein UreH